jgi:hypothetical protein
MTKIVGRNASIYVDDNSAACKAISADLSTATLTGGAESPEVTGFGDTTRQRLVNGLQEWELGVEGFVHDQGATTAGCILFPLLSGSTYIQFGPNGSAAGNPKFTGCAVLTEFNQDFNVEDAATFSATFVSRSGSLSASTW